MFGSISPKSDSVHSIMYITLWKIYILQPIGQIDQRIHARKWQKVRWAIVVGYKINQQKEFNHCLYRPLIKVWTILQLSPVYATFMSTVITPTSNANVSQGSTKKSFDTNRTGKTCTNKSATSFAENRVCSLRVGCCRTYDSRWKHIRQSSSQTCFHSFLIQLRKQGPYVMIFYLYQQVLFSHLTTSFIKRL